MDAKEDEKARAADSALAFEAREKKRYVRRFFFGSNGIQVKTLSNEARNTHFDRARTSDSRLETVAVESSTTGVRASRPEETERGSYSLRAFGIQPFRGLPCLLGSPENASRRAPRRSSSSASKLKEIRSDTTPSRHVNMEKTSDAYRFGTRATLVRRTRVARFGWKRRVSSDSARNGGIFARSSSKGLPEALEIRVGEGFLRLETGEIGRQASGSVIATSGETVRSSWKTRKAESLERNGKRAEKTMSTCFSMRID